MRKINHIFWLLSLLLLGACTESEIDGQPLEEGLPATITLTVAAQNNELQSRSVSPEAAENAVNNLFVFVFDAVSQKILSTRFFEATEFTGTNKNTVALATTTGQRHIYAVANIGLGMVDVTMAQLQAITTESELQSCNLQLNQNTVSRGTSFVMSGCVENADGTVKAVTINSGNTTIADAIRLRRVDSKIQFKITTAEGVTFVAKDWQVVQAPRRSTLFTQPAGTFQAAADYFTSNWAHFEGEGAEMGRTFAFYVLENKQTPKQRITATGDAGYALREKQDKSNVQPDGSIINGPFVYANNNSTYVRLRGHVEYGASSAKISANVVYTIHLGYTGTPPDPNNYDNLRNTSYIYTLKINSVNNISVEAISPDGTELQPGAEGDITAATESFYFDSHYETATVVIPQLIIVPGKLYWYVDTPFSVGAKTATETPADYKWILFALNAKNAQGKYTNDLPAFSNNVRTANITSVADYQAGTTELLNVDQLLAVLELNKREEQKHPNDYTGTLFDTDGNLLFTAFVNEFYYDQDPTTAVPSTSELWKRFVNQPERSLRILSGTSISLDGQSIKTDALFLFRQASIQTMYSTTYSGNKTAWGTEMTSDKKETYTWSASINTNTDADDGRSNTLKLWNITASPSLRWDTYVTTATGATAPAYAGNAVYACLQRNRDNNGNNLIDKQEVRWYLTSINQLSDLWIGEPSFDLQARLYQKTNSADQLYVSSTTINGGNSEQLIWAKEGSSVGPVGGGGGIGLSVRCVRNLGIDAATDGAPQDFASYDAATKTVSLEGLDGKSIRDYTQQAELPEHHERQADNKPWTKFVIDGSFRNLNKTWLQITTNIRNNTQNTAGRVDNRCPDGWRMPNQRELALMFSRASIHDNNAMSRTSYSFGPAAGQSNARPCFAIVNSVLWLQSGNPSPSGGLRCVKDVN
ncbi:MAG: fimbrial protein [Alistipes sp.]